MNQQQVHTNLHQNRLTPGPLLNQKGSLSQAGYSTSLVKEYRRSDIREWGYKIKQWDYYYVGDDKYGVALTVADLSYSALISVTVLDFINKKQTTKSITKMFTFGSLNLPQTSKHGDIVCTARQYSVRFLNNHGERRLICQMNHFQNDSVFKCDINLKQNTPHSMVIATPFDKQRHFYYNQKINLMKAVGQFSIGQIQYHFTEKSYGVLDWGRGVWTYNNTWYWASMSGEFEGHQYGFNLGYGFGDTSKSTENIFYYDHQFFKLDDVIFRIPTDDLGNQQYMKDWSFSSISKNIQLKFQPLIDRFANVNFCIIQSLQHQVFGKFTGQVTVGKKSFKFQNLMGFAQKVKNRW